MTRLLAYAQLVRLPNVFTAMADIFLGALVTGALLEHWAAFLLLLAASSCLYCAGMVWNDYFDLEQDRRERPFRPIPSGRVTPAVAARLGGLLLAAGVGGAVLADLVRGGCWCSTVTAVLLVGAILLYDAVLKRTAAGPVGMGMCRCLNVLLGLSLAPGAAGLAGIVLALAVGTYIVGVTWFARTEARASNQVALAGASVVMLAGLLLALPLPALHRRGLATDGDDDGLSAAARWGAALFPYLLVGFAFYVGIPVSRAINRPAPQFVQRAVKRAVLGLVLLDAVLATALTGPLSLALVLLLLPSLYLGRWLYST
jgi:4-hydroxybenzoate polyprenyltransferase